MAGIPSNLNESFKAIARKGEVYDKEDSPTDRYYALLTEVENVTYSEGGKKLWSIDFEIVPFEWMESAVLSQTEATRGPPPSGPASLLAFDEAAPDDIAKALTTPVDEVVEGEWYIITLGKGGVAAKRANAVALPSIRQVKAKGFKAPRRQQRKLNMRFRPVFRFSAKDLKKLLAGLVPREIGVMDVGQAGCNLVYDDQGVPQFYVDVGFPLFPNLASLPPANGLGNIEIHNPGPCLGNNPAVILTHFHWDHYAMARVSTNAGALVDRNWIVPNQVAGGAAWVFLNNILASPNGQLHVFPVALAGIVGGNVNVIQCVPVLGIAAGNLNNSGLAAVVKMTNLLPNRTLLPGDAAFQAIPGVGAIVGLRWMTATHHGSDTDLIPLVGPSPIPAPQVVNQGRIAYSYGINGGVGGLHCYGHPDAPAVAAYQGRGWGVGGVGGGFVASTAETGPNSGVAGRGNIMMCSNVMPPACGVANCPFHAFPKLLI